MDPGAFDLEVSVQDQGASVQGLEAYDSKLGAYQVLVGLMVIDQVKVDL
jgi:hypothetical protein